MSGMTTRFSLPDSFSRRPAVDEGGKRHSLRTRAQHEEITSNRDSISSILGLSYSARPAPASALPGASTGPQLVPRTRKKNQALFGESFDPTALRAVGKKVVPKADTSREVRPLLNFYYNGACSAWTGRSGR